MSGLKGNQKKGSDGKFIANPAFKPKLGLKGLAETARENTRAAFKEPTDPEAAATVAFIAASTIV